MIAGSKCSVPSVTVLEATTIGLRFSPLCCPRNSTVTLLGSGPPLTSTSPGSKAAISNSAVWTSAAVALKAISGDVSTCPSADSNRRRKAAADRLSRE